MFINWTHFLNSQTMTTVANPGKFSAVNTAGAQHLFYSFSEVLVDMELKTGRIKNYTSNENEF